MPLGFDQVVICNMALAHIGSKSTIESIDENTPAAKQCKLWYDAARIRTLEAYDWTSARKTQTLSIHSVAAPTFRWAFRYQYPTDCVAPRFIENPAGSNKDPVPFTIENAGDGTVSILTDAENAVLIYTFNLSTITAFTIHFVETFALALSVRMCYKLTGKRSLLKAVTDAFNISASQAQYFDGTGTVVKEERDAATIEARR